jgi:hypothetical protein
MFKLYNNNKPAISLPRAQSQKSRSHWLEPMYASFMQPYIGKCAYVHKGGCNPNISSLVKWWRIYTTTKESSIVVSYKTRPSDSCMLISSIFKSQNANISLQLPSAILDATDNMPWILSRKKLSTHASTTWTCSWPASTRLGSRAVGGGCQLVTCKLRLSATARGSTMIRIRSAT